MIKVLIVDDEPFIRQGIQILINWEKHGFEICGEASNGLEAIELMKKEPVDLVITDIKMPQMDGLKLIEYTRNNISGDIQFLLLSGFCEFEYAKKAIKYNAVDYILKPIQREELIRVLEEYKEQFNRKLENKKKMELSEKVVFDRHLSLLIAGKQDRTSFEYVIAYLADYKGVRYINLDYDLGEENYSQLSEEEKRKAQYVLYDSLIGFLKDNWYHAYLDTNNRVNEYATGLIYVKELANIGGLGEREYIEALYAYLRSNIPYKIILYVGQKVDDIRLISESYKSAIIAKSFRQVSDKKHISYYEEMEGNLNRHVYPIDKTVMDELIRAIEENDIEAINRKIDIIYEQFKKLVFEPDMININLDYLRYNLINLAKELDREADHAEVYKIISQCNYDHIIFKGSADYFKKFALEFSNYLKQLRHYALGGVLTEIEKEITEHYMDNLSLKSLSEKYYINSAYLGQIFKKKYGVSFKDYLNNYRIERAAELLIRTDEKVYAIAEMTGFNNTDYFINKFVQLKGITPLQYRKQILFSHQN